MNIKSILFNYLGINIFKNREIERQLVKTLNLNKKFKDIHKNRRCFIIGNGPSLKLQNITPLKDEITIVMNAFWKHPIITRFWQPKYYCFADPIMFDGSSQFRDFFKSLNKKISSSSFIVPLTAKKTIEKQKLLPLDQTYYVQFKNTLNNLNNDIDLSKSIPTVQSTSQLAIEAALYMGCNPIYLLGLDHDWLTHRGLDRHFYEGNTVDNHKTAVGDLSKYSYYNDVKSFLNLMKIYEYLKEIANNNDIKIYNATDGGYLEIFTRERFSDLFVQKR